MIVGGNPTEAHPVSLQHILEGKELNRANMIVIDPRMTRTAAHATRICPRTPRDSHSDHLRHAEAQPMFECKNDYDVVGENDD
jgi:hypothetical protein